MHPFLKLLGWAGRVFDFIIGALVYVAAAILTFIMLAVCWDVIARAVVGKPLSWVLEFTEYSLLYITFMCTAWVLKDEGHVTTDLFLLSLKKKNQHLMTMVTSVIGGLVCLILTWYGTAVSIAKLRAGSFEPTAIQPPDFPLYIIIPIGSFLLFVQFMRRAWAQRKKWMELKNNDRE